MARWVVHYQSRYVVILLFRIYLAPTLTDAKEIAPIRELLAELAPLTQKDWDFFSSKLVRHTASKNEIILAAGKTENHLSFLVQGVVRFFIPTEDADRTLGFSFEGSFFSAYDSFITQGPSAYSIATISPAIIYQISYPALQEIYATTQAGERIGRRAGEALFLNKSKRELSLLLDSAEERYLRLFEDRPELIQRIPLKYIASYIGITPQALSRIRQRIS